MESKCQDKVEGGDKWCVMERWHKKAGQDKAGQGKAGNSMGLSRTV